MHANLLMVSQHLIVVNGTSRDPPEKGFYMLLPVNKADHMCQDTKVLRKVLSQIHIPLYVSRRTVPTQKCFKTDEPQGQAMITPHPPGYKPIDILQRKSRIG